MLNKPLYEVLHARFGKVRITNENSKRIERRHRDGRHEVISAGENYGVDCPLCGDTKGRLSISYLWLEKPPLEQKRRTDLAHCYNEECPVREEKFWQPLIAEIEMAKVGLLISGPDERITEIKEIPEARTIELPKGFQLLDTLPADHPALAFIKKQYSNNFDPKYLAQNYGVGFTAESDPLHPRSRNRVIFPVTQGGELILWQGRTIEDIDPRWYIPLGYSKPFYNGDKIDPMGIPIIAEGIPSAIACGPNAGALFGKTITNFQLDYIASRWSCAIIATDPETFVPDPRERGGQTVFAQKLKAKLDSRLKIPARMIRWPMELLELGRRNNNGEDIKVPDPADVGMSVMNKLIQEASHGIA